MAVNKKGGENFIWYYCQRKCRDILKENRIRKECYSDLYGLMGTLECQLIYTLNSRLAFILLVKIGSLSKKVLQSLFTSSHFN